MVLKRKYQSQSNSVASVSFTEFVSGRGIVILNPIVTSGAYLLSTNTAYNFAGDTSVADTSTNGNLRALTTNIDIDFDAEFGQPIIVEGDALVNFTSLIRRISGGSVALSSTFTAQIAKYDGTTETVLASGSHVISETLNDGESAAQEAAYTLTLPRTSLAKGDKIRLNLQATSDGATWDAWILVDSKNREITIGNYTANFSNAVLNLPVVADSI